MNEVSNPRSTLGRGDLEITGLQLARKISTMVAEQTDEAPEIPLALQVPTATAEVLGYSALRLLPGSAYSLGDLIGGDRREVSSSMILFGTAQSGESESIPVAVSFGATKAPVWNTLTVQRLQPIPPQRLADIA